MKKIWSLSNMYIVDIYNNIKKNELKTKPYYQRKLVWTLSDKEYFIDTILKGLPFPEVYLCKGELDTETLKSVSYVVDGQQRLTTICQYIDNELPFKKVPLYKDLSKDEQEDFLYYEVVIRQLGQIDDSKIKEIFDRLNRTDYTLNKTELLYAQYQGEFISTARKLTEQNTDFFDIILGEKSISRMVDLSFILQIMSTLENKIYFSGESEVATYVNLYNEIYEYKDSMEIIVNNAFKVFKEINLPYDSIFYKKAASFSLLVELCKNQNKVDVKKLKDNLMEFEKSVLENKEKDIETNNFARFYIYIYQGTASKTARDYRGNMIKELIDKSK